MKEKIQNFFTYLIGSIIIIAIGFGLCFIGELFEKKREPKFYELAFVFPGESIYHCFDCIKVHESDGEEFEMTISEAKKQGKIPCSICSPDETSASYAKEDDGDYVPQFPYK